MSEQSLLKPACLMLVTVVVVVATWELYLRNQGHAITYDDGSELWADKRAMVYEPADKAVVFIGSSRNKYDLDINTWQNLTGTHAIQLAREGSSPMPILNDLSNDPDFRGRLVVDVTEGLFFSNAPPNLEEPQKDVQYYKDRTLAQQFSFELNYLLESQLVFLDRYNFSLNAQLDALEIPSRPGVFMMPIFPLDFTQSTFERQSVMSERFMADTALQNKVKGIWAFFRKLSKEPPASGENLEGMLQLVKTATDKIRARGGEVIFVRTPSSGPFWQGEQMAFPREKYWERILTTTQCPGIHFADYPAIDHFECPEFSHLSPQDAVVFTRHLAEIMEKEKGWKFPRSGGR